MPTGNRVTREIDASFNRAKDVHIERLQREVEQLRKAAQGAPCEMRADDFGDREELTPMQTAEIQRSVVAGKFQYRPGELRELVEVDDAGRKIRKFFGDPKVAWAPFCYPPKLATFGPGVKQK